MKTYRAIRHDIVRTRQKDNSDCTRHPNEKINQILSCLENWHNHTLELFAGEGNLTEIYAEHGYVEAVESVGKIYEKLKDNIFANQGRDGNVNCIKKDSYKHFHELISKGRKYNIIDLDPYGFPNRFFPDIFLLINDGLMFVTMPKPYVNILNGITQTHLISYYGEHNPKERAIVERIVLWGLCHWRRVELLDSIDLGSVWRFAFKVEKVKATEYTGVRNR